MKKIYVGPWEEVFLPRYPLIPDYCDKLKFSVRKMLGNEDYFALIRIDDTISWFSGKYFIGGARFFTLRGAQKWADKYRIEMIPGIPYHERNNIDIVYLSKDQFNKLSSLA